MITIRRGVFETNSSSSHSIVLMKGDHPVKTKLEGNMIDADWRVDEKGVMYFWYECDLDFGRSPFQILKNWYDRLRYCIAYYSHDENKLNEIEQICTRRIAGFTQFKFNKDRWDETDYHGYVDHQSMGLLDHALEKYKASLEDFIFNDKFIVIVDGDEYNVFYDMIESGMFNEEAVDDISSASDSLEEGYWKTHKDDEE